MRRLVPLIAGVLVFGLGAISAAQEITPAGSPAATVCAAPEPIASPATLDVPGTAQNTPVMETEAGSEAQVDPRTPPPGTPADAALLDRIRSAEQNLAACFNAGDYLTYLALFTPTAWLAEFGISDPADTPRHNASYLILREEILSVSDPQTHADGRVSAEVIFVFEGDLMRARDIFVESDGWLLLDEIIGLPVNAVPAGTPALLDEETLAALVIQGFAPGSEPATVPIGTLGSAIGLSPGGALDLMLGVLDYEVCGIGVRCLVPVEVRATWSVTPAGSAEIDPVTGLLTIDPATPGGASFTVRAEVEGGRRVVETEVHIVTPESHPLLGTWREAGQISCDGGAETVPPVPIEELVFAADGTFAVTWMPFESYVDYWGTYTIDLTQGTLSLTATGGNYVPEDIDGEGRFALDADGTLLLIDLWLGSPPDGSEGANCGHRFGG
jgi:hypothetical protein